MSKKLLGLLSILVSSSMLVACNNGSKDSVKEDESQQYAIYELAKDAGFSGTYDEWLASIKGEPGADGKDGVSVSKVEKSETKGLVDTYTITFSDGSKTTFTITNGEKGDPGEKGAPGEKGEKGEDLVHLKYNISLDLQDGTTPIVIKSASFLEFVQKFTNMNLEMVESKDEIPVSIESNDGKEIPFTDLMELVDGNMEIMNELDYYFDKDVTFKLNSKSNIFKVNFVNDLTNTTESINIPLYLNRPISYDLPVLPADPESNKNFLGWDFKLGKDDYIISTSEELNDHPDFFKKGVNEITLNAVWYYNEDVYQVVDLPDAAQLNYPNYIKETLTIPEKIKNNKPVRYIGSLNAPNITTLEIPGFIEEVNNIYAPKLTDLKLNEGTLGGGTINNGLTGKQSLKNINIPNSIKNINLSSVDTLEKVTVPDLNKFIKKFDNFNSANDTYISLPYFNKGYDLYHNETLISDLVIPDGMYSLSNPIYYKIGVGLSGFNMKSLTIGKDIEVLDNSYCRCFGLEKVKVNPENKYYDSRNDSNTIIESNTDRLLLALDLTTIPDTVKILGNYSMTGTAPDSLVLPKVTAIEEYAVTELSDNVKELIIPSSVYYMESHSIILPNNCEVKFEDKYEVALAKGFKENMIGNINPSLTTFDYKNPDAKPGIPELPI